MDKAKEECALYIKTKKKLSLAPVINQEVTTGYSNQSGG